MENARIPTSEELLAEMGWVRQLARALVKDDAVAADVAQDTWLVATERQPDADRPLRPWLARVVTNLVRTRRRGDVRREQRGVAFEKERTVPTPAELVERVELQRAVADEVLALAEPYRSTVLLHFVEGLTSVEIARKLGIPAGSVRRRLTVALEQLREALRKRTDQPRRGWLAALVPFATLPTSNPLPFGTVPPVPAAIGVLAMKKVIAVIVLIVLLLAIGAGVVLRRHAGSDDVGSASSPNAAGPQRPHTGSADAARTTMLESVVQAGAPPRRIAGRVVFRGAPVGGARVQLGIGIVGEPTTLLLMPGAVTETVEPVASRRQAYAEVR